MIQKKGNYRVEIRKRNLLGLLNSHRTSCSKDSSAASTQEQHEAILQALSLLEKRLQGLEGDFRTFFPSEYLDRLNGLLAQSRLQSGIFVKLDSLAFVVHSLCLILASAFALDLQCSVLVFFTNLIIHDSMKNVIQMLFDQNVFELVKTFFLPNSGCSLRLKRDAVILCHQATVSQQTISLLLKTDILSAVIVDICRIYPGTKESQLLDDLLFAAVHLFKRFCQYTGLDAQVRFR